MFFDFAFFNQPCFFFGDFFQQYAGGFVVGVLGDEFAHDGELEDGLFELVDAVFGGEQGVEMVGDALPCFGKLILDSAAVVSVASRVSTRV